MTNGVSLKLVSWYSHAKVFFVYIIPPESLPTAVQFIDRTMSSFIISSNSYLGWVLHLESSQNQGGSYSSWGLSKIVIFLTIIRGGFLGFDLRSEFFLPPLALHPRSHTQSHQIEKDPMTWPSLWHDCWTLSLHVGKKFNTKKKPVVVTSAHVAPLILWHKGALPNHSTVDAKKTTRRQDS
jgi:hypothetical protein